MGVGRDPKQRLDEILKKQRDQLKSRRKPDEGENDEPNPQKGETEQRDQKKENDDQN